MFEWNLLFDKSGGLSNLANEVEVPSVAVVIQRRTTCLHTGDIIIDVDIHRSPDGTYWVTNHGLPDAIGHFDSLNAIDSAWTGCDHDHVQIEDI